MKKRFLQKDYIIMLLVVLGLVGLFLFWTMRPAPTATKTFPNYAKAASEDVDVGQRAVQNYEKCKKAGGILHTRPVPNQCYYEGVIYYELLRKDLENFLDPEPLTNYTECRIHEGVPSNSDSSCTTWNKKTYYYDGPEITSYQDCMKVEPFQDDVGGPHTCIAPDGTTHRELAE